MALKASDKAPKFSLPSTEGGTVSLDSLRGKRVVLYFYPKDDTPGCTREACGSRDNLARVRSAGALIYGVSKDSLASHEKFRDKYELPFPLLSDAGNEVARKFGAFGKKMMYGKEVEGLIRSTFLLGGDGRIEAAWSPVKVDGHVDQVLAALQGDAPAPKAKARAKAKAKPKAKKKAAPKAKARR
jgi:peroxiredoxin Q/BCP